MQWGWGPLGQAGNRAAQPPRFRCRGVAWPERANDGCRVAWVDESCTVFAFLRRGNGMLGMDVFAGESRRHP